MGSVCDTLLYIIGTTCSMSNEANDTSSTSSLGGETSLRRSRVHCMWHDVLSHDLMRSNRCPLPRRLQEQRHLIHKKQPQWSEMFRCRRLLVVRVHTFPRVVSANGNPPRSWCSMAWEVCQYGNWLYHVTLWKPGRTKGRSCVKWRGQRER